MDWVFVALGFVVGMLVAASGVGGGALMTPGLIAAGISPATAVGTDLMYAALVKSGAVICHRRRRPVAWRYAMLLAAGSLPAALLVLAAMERLRPASDAYQALVTTTLGVALVASAAGLFARQRLTRERRAPRPRHRAILTVLAGMLIGALVTLTSVGAGALGMLALLLLHPDQPVHRLVAVDLAHAVPLTLLAAAGHWHLGTLDVTLLAALLIGGVPGMVVGVRTASFVPDRVLRNALATVLFAMGAYLVSSPLLAPLGEPLLAALAT